MICATCQHARKNTGLIIPTVEREYFCEVVPDVPTADILTGILQEFAKDERCPSHKGLEAMPDSYLAKDLEAREIVSEAFRQTIIPTSDDKD